MKAKTIGNICVLIFDDAEEAHIHGANLCLMEKGCRFYAWGPDETTEEELYRAIDEAQEGENLPAD